MKKNKIKYWVILIILLGTVDISTPGNVASESQAVIVEAGINGKHLKEGWKLVQKGWKSIKGCSRDKPNLNPKPAPKPVITPNPLIADIVVSTKMLSKALGEIKSTEEVLPKIEEYLSHTKPHKGSAKVITCLKTDADKVRISLYENRNHKPLQDRLLNASIKAIKAGEYDINAMQEYYIKGIDNLEYIQFIIPRKQSYILDGKYSDRLFECMIFNVPKDINGNWLKFKEYLIRFFNDLLNRPSQLWDELKFANGLKKININPRDISEIRQYMFAFIQADNSNRNHEIFQSNKYSEQKIA